MNKIWGKIVFCCIVLLDLYINMESLVFHIKETEKKKSMRGGFKLVLLTDTDSISYSILILVIVLHYLRKLNKV